MICKNFALFTFFSIVYSNYESFLISKSIEDANVQYNHAQSYYWLSRNRLNSLYEVITADSHLDSAKQILSRLKINSQNKTDLRKDIQVLQSELDMITNNYEENLNGRYPMYMHLTVKITDN